MSDPDPTRRRLDAFISASARQLRDQLPRWAVIADSLSERLANERHGDLERWAAALDALPTSSPTDVELTQQVAARGQIAGSEQLTAALQELKPWRKGPFNLFGLHLDTEWRSDWKWQRLAQHLPCVDGHRVLDVGCGNGYYGWRLLGAGAQQVVGIDPTLLFVLQHAAVSHLFGEALAPRNLVLPLRLEDTPSGAGEFDTVLSMGVLYHRRNPVDHLSELAAHCRTGGNVVIETLVTPRGDSFVPTERYARMRNVWCIPNVEDLLQWCERAGLANPRCVDVTRTSTDEQRPTPWMTFESLQHSLDPSDSSLTIEGYPAPHRAIVLAGVR